MHCLSSGTINFTNHYQMLKLTKNKITIYLIVISEVPPEDQCKPELCMDFISQPEHFAQRARYWEKSSSFSFDYKSDVN